MSGPAANRNVWLTDVLRPAGMAIMAGCLALSVAEMLHALFPFWNVAWTVAGSVLAALEAHLSYRVLHARPMFMTDRWRMRVIEAAFLFVLIKLGGLLSLPPAAILTELQSWAGSPANILDPQTLVNFLLAILILFAVTDTLADLDELSDPEWTLSPISPRERVAERFFWGGLLVLIAAGVARIGLSEMINLERGPVTGLVLNVLIYFVVGLGLLGQVTFVHLSAVWQGEGAQVADTLAGRWVRHTLLFLLIVALVAFALPTVYGLGLLGLVGTVLTLIAFVIYVILWLLVSLIVALLAQFLPILPLPPIAPPVPPNFSQPEAAAPPGFDLTWLELLRTVLFWTIVVAMVGYIIYAYLRERPELVKALKNSRLLRLLQRVWQALRQQMGYLAEAVRETLSLERLRQLLGRVPLPPMKFFKLGGASPREQIFYYYLSTLRRAAQLGFPRQPAQTPREYAPVLEAQLTQAQADVHELTEAFVNARYSAPPVEPAQARGTRAAWERVRAALTHLKRAQRHRDTEN